MIKHIKLWNYWRKNCLNTKWHKLLVLLKLRHSPTMSIMKYESRFQNETD